jgi:hypothetical protein
MTHKNSSMSLPITEMEEAMQEQSNEGFWGWYDNVRRTAPMTAVGRIMTAAGYHIAHTGGGCLCWEQTKEDGRYQWICDQGNGLGEKEDERYLVGLYDSEGEIIAQGDVANLQAALIG